MSSSYISKKTIVVLGGGFAGLSAVRTLARGFLKYGLTEQYRLLLIDKNDFHTYLPMLYLVASMPERAASHAEVMRAVTIPFKTIIRNLPIEFCKTTIEKIDFERKDLYTDSGSIVHADALIVALGSVPSYFGMESVATHALTLKSFADARRISAKIFTLVAGEEARKHIRIIVVGGGPTGVELAAELAVACQKTCQQKNKTVCTSHVTLITGSEPALAPFGEKMSTRATDRLKKMGVHIRSRERVISATANQVSLESGAVIPYDVFVWTGGVRQSALLARSDLKKDEKTKRIIVSEEFEARLFDDYSLNASFLYVVGDGAYFVNKKTGDVVPMLAHAAISEGAVAAQNLLSELRADEGLIDAPVKKFFRPWRKYPYVAPVGGLYALAQFGGFLLSGFFGWLVKFFIELQYLLSILPVYKALQIWILGARVFSRKKKG